MSFLLHILLAVVIYFILWYIFEYRPEKLRIKRGSYHSYLKSKQWKNRKIKYKEKHEVICRRCETTDRVIHLHHKSYERLGKERDSDLCFLCSKCHTYFHRQMEIKFGRKTFPDMIKETNKFVNTGRI